MASETFRQNCYDDTKRQRILFASDNLTLSNEDISATNSVKFGLASCTAQQIQFGCMPVNTISLSILNEDGRIASDSIVGNEFKCHIGVEVSTEDYLAPSKAISAVDTGKNMISVHTEAPYVRGNVTFGSLLPQLMNGWNCKIMLAYDVLYFVVKHGTDMYYAKHERTGNNSFGEYETPSDSECDLLYNMMNVSTFNAVAYYDGGMTEYTYKSVTNPRDTWNDMNQTIWDGTKSNTWGYYSGYTTFNCVRYESVAYGVWHFDRPRRVNSAVLTLSGSDRMVKFDEDSGEFVASVPNGTFFTPRTLIEAIASFKGVPVGDLSSLNELADEVQINGKTYYQNKSLRDLLSYAFEVGGANGIIDRYGRLSASSAVDEEVDIPYVYSFDEADYTAHTIGKMLVCRQEEYTQYEEDETVENGVAYDWNDNPFFDNMLLEGSWFSNGANKKYGGFKNAITVTDADYSLWADNSYVWTDELEKRYVDSATVVTGVKQSGSGTPSPSNLMPISGTSVANFYQYGKNLWKPGTTDTKLGVTATFNADGSVSLSGRATNNAIFTCFEGVFLPAGTYTLAKSGNTNIRIIVRAIIASGTTLMQATTNNVTATLDGTTTYAGLIRVASGFDTTGITLYPQFEKGSSLGTFAPYVAPETNEWDLGTTVYSATINTKTGEGEERYAYKLFTGASTENWNWSQSSTKQRAYISLPGAKKGTNTFYSNFISRQGSSASYPAEYAGWINNNGSIIIGVPSTITSAADWKAYLAEHNLQIAYELDSSVDVTVNTHEFAEYPTDEIFCDSGSTTWTYRYGVKHRNPIFTMNVEWNGSGRVTYTNYGEEERTYASYSSRTQGTTNTNDKNIQGLNKAQYANKLAFDERGLTIQSGGMRMLNLTGEEVLSADAEGNLKVKGNVQADTGYIGQWQIIEDGIKCGWDTDFVFLGYDMGEPVFIAKEATGVTPEGETIASVEIGGGSLYFYTYLDDEQQDFAYLGINYTTGNIELSKPLVMNNVGTTATSSNTVLVSVYDYGNYRKFYVSTSLREMKDNIKTIEDASKKVDNLRGVSFTSKCEADDPNVVLYGFIAEEVEDAVPELASYTDGKLQGVQYDRVCALLVEDNKACHRRIEALEKKIEELERRLDK